MPVQYPDGIIREHLHTREAAGLFDVSHMGQAWLTGDADVGEALESLVPGDIRGLDPGQMRYTMLLNDDGGIVGRLVEAVYEPEDDNPHRADTLYFDFDPILDGIPGYAWIFPYPKPGGPGGYTPAPDNPFPQNPDVYAYGLRAPFRGAQDHLGRLIISDVGAVDWEELNLVDGPGLNFGWDVAEGPCEADCEGLTDPVISWPHAVNDYTIDDPDAVPVARWVAWVSPFYDPAPELDRYGGLLTRRMFFGDMCRGWMRTLGIDDDGAVDYDQPAGHLEHAAAWEVGPDGYVYAVASGGCVNVEFDDFPAQLLRVVGGSGRGPVGLRERP